MAFTTSKETSQTHARSPLRIALGSRARLALVNNKPHGSGNFECRQRAPSPLLKARLAMETLLTQIQQTSLVEWLGTATGLLGVYLSIKEKALAWLFYILCYALYAYLSYSAALYAAMALNACFIPISIYGWWQWSRSPNGTESAQPKDELRITGIKSAPLFWAIVICILGTIAIGTLLARYTEGAAPYLDSFATTASFLAQWMLSRKYIENWLAWIAADVAFIILWGSQGYWVAVAMFLIFTALAVFGYTSWKKEIRQSGH